VSKLRIGVVGAGNISKYHLKAYAAHDETELVAIADINADRAQSVADEWGARRSYGDAAELFADPDVDAVSICTWNDSHAQLAIQAVEAGKHVLLEKPMSTSHAEADRLGTVAAASDRIVQMGFVRRHSANCQVLKSYVDAGDLGDIYYARASCIRRMGNPGGWFADKARSGGGPLIDIGVHVIDLAWYLMGSPKVATISGNSYDHLGNRANITTFPRYTVSDYDPTKNDVEDMVNAVIRFDNGASLIADASFSLHATEDRLGVSVHGTKGGADLEPLQIATEQHGSMVNIEPQLRSNNFEFGPAFANEISHFVDACKGRSESIAPAWHGVEIMKILDGIYASAEQGRELQF